MPIYRDTDGDSGVVSYEYGPDWIEVQFGAGSYRNYRYEASGVGQSRIDTMKRLADAGEGLNAYINTNRGVAKGYSRRW
jgi:hypothetical protein